jgi:hypothetical protein
MVVDVVSAGGRDWLAAVVLLWQRLIRWKVCSVVEPC